MENCPLTGRPCNLPKKYHVSEMIEGKGRMVTLCARCANAHFNSPSVQLRPDLAFISLPQSEPDPNCPNCNSTVDDIRESGRLGCLYCYQHFGSTALAFLDKGGEQSRPLGLQRGESMAAYVERLQSELPSLVEREKYEEAADIRDRIKRVSEIIEEKHYLESQVEEAARGGEYERVHDLNLSIVSLLARLKAQ
jgi:protein arginine kinase activator